MDLPNEFQAPTAANLARKTITELAVYVYQVALAFTENAETADNVLRAAIAVAEYARTSAAQSAADARNAAQTAAEDAAAAIAPTLADAIRAEVAADADRAAAAASNAETNAGLAHTDADLARMSADRAEVAATTAERVAADAATVAANTIRAEVAADATRAEEAANRADTAAQSAEGYEAVCNAYAGGAADSAERAAADADRAEAAADNAVSDVVDSISQIIASTPIFTEMPWRYNSSVGVYEVDHDVFTGVWLAVSFDGYGSERATTMMYVPPRVGTTNGKASSYIIQRLDDSIAGTVGYKVKVETFYTSFMGSESKELHITLDGKSGEQSSLKVYKIGG